MNLNGAPPITIYQEAAICYSLAVALGVLMAIIYSCMFTRMYFPFKKVEYVQQEFSHSLIIQ